MYNDIDGRGLIIAGYPGVGKSSIAKNGRFIDLESSLFRDAAGVFDPYMYVRTAVVLASQGHTVLTSTHKDVVDILTNLFSDEIPHSKEVKEYTSNILGAVIFCPDPAREHQDLWLEKLEKRFNESGLEKDKRAYERCMWYWREDLDYLCTRDLPVYHPIPEEVLNVGGFIPNLENAICTIRSELLEKEREKGDKP